MDTTKLANGCAEGRSGVSVLRSLAAVLVAALAGACGESGPTLTIDIYKKEVAADDGYVLSAFDLHLRGHPRDETPKAWMFYLVGSEPVAVMDGSRTVARANGRGGDDEPG